MTERVPLSREPLTRERFLEIADHTLLAPRTAPAQLEAFLDDAAALGVRRVCIRPTLLPVEKRGLELVTVVGFPSGVHKAEIVAREAELAVRDGADEIDTVVDPGLIATCSWSKLEASIRAVREAVPGVVLKVIIESATLSDEQIVGCCRAAEAAGADFVKTSTGFDPAGGASTRAVRLMAETVGGRLGVKASGGIRSAADVLALWEAGATRFGVSATEAILASWGAESRGEGGAEGEVGASAY